MKEIKVCNSCGFISTIRSEFTHFKGMTICNDCVDSYNNPNDEYHTQTKNSIDLKVSIQQQQIGIQA